jgi:nitrogen fixation-related uncharacterized protein
MILIPAAMIAGPLGITTFFYVVCLISLIGQL